MESGFLEFIRYFISGDDADIIAGNHMSRICHADGKGFAGLNVFHCFMTGAQTHGDLRVVADAAPGSVHGVRRAVFIIGGDDQHRLRISIGLGPEVFSHSNTSCMMIE